MPTKSKKRATSAKKKTTATRTKTRSKAKPAAKRNSKRAGRGGAANAAFMKPMKPDAALASVVGDNPIPRSEVTKRVWAYIKKHGLQDAKDRRSINADDKLGPVLNGKKKVTMFELTKLVNSHLS
jgi:chromatin remodeling complex protein RSC6